MKIVGHGRIVLWEGASLWAFDVPPQRDGLPTNRLHSHHALQLTVSVGGRFAILTEDERIEGPAVLIASDVPHAFAPEGKVALLFVEPESCLGAALKRRMAGTPIIRLEQDELGNTLTALDVIWAEPRSDDETIAARGRALLQHVVGEALPPTDIDPRIARALAWLAPHLHDRIGLPEAAAIACLSESRFSHLFTSEVGLPFRTYLLWRRLMLAVERTAAGSSLTVAAHEAGFADSAHFSRTFHRMFGIPAASLDLI